MSTKTKRKPESIKKFDFEVVEDEEAVAIIVWKPNATKAIREAVAKIDFDSEVYGGSLSDAVSEFVEDMNSKL